MKILILIGCLICLIASVRSYILYDLCKKDVFFYNKTNRISAFFTIGKVLNFGTDASKAIQVNWTEVNPESVSWMETIQINAALNLFNSDLKKFYTALPHNLNELYLTKGKMNVYLHQKTLLEIKESFKNDKIEFVYKKIKTEMNKNLKNIDDLMPAIKYQLTEDLLTRNELKEFFIDYFVNSQTYKFPLGTDDLDIYYKNKIIKIKDVKWNEKNEQIVSIEIHIPAIRRNEFKSDLKCVASANLSPFFKLRTKQ